MAHRPQPTNTTPPMPEKIRIQWFGTKNHAIACSASVNAVEMSDSACSIPPSPGRPGSFGPPGVPGMPNHDDTLCHHAGMDPCACPDGTPAGAPTVDRTLLYDAPAADAQAPGSGPGACWPSDAASVSPDCPAAPGAAKPVSIPPSMSPSFVAAVTCCPGRTAILNTSSATYTCWFLSGPLVSFSVIHVPGYGAPTAPDHACPADVITPGPSAYTAPDPE